MGLTKILMSVKGLDTQEIPQRNNIRAMVNQPYPWPRPKDEQNKTDKLLLVFGVMHVIVKFKKDKGNALKKHILKDIVSRGFDVKIEGIQEKHQQAIEEKDTVLALLSDDLQDSDNQIQAIQYKNVALQAQRDMYKEQLQKYQDIITHLKKRHVLHANNQEKTTLL